jgi:hypothetical protein
MSLGHIRDNEGCEGIVGINKRPLKESIISFILGMDRLGMSNRGLKVKLDDLCIKLTNTTIV